MGNIFVDGANIAQVFYEYKRNGLIGNSKGSDGMSLQEEIFVEFLKKLEAA